MSDDIRDQLPDDLNAVDHIGAYDFPDNSRRRIPGVMYAVLAVSCVVGWLIADSQDSAIINRGLLFAAILLAVMSIITITSSWRMTIDESEALVRATRHVGFAVGHASAQQVWRGVRSRRHGEFLPTALRSLLRNAGWFWLMLSMVVWWSV